MEGLNITWQCLHSFSPPLASVTVFSFLTADDLLSIATLKSSYGKSKQKYAQALHNIANRLVIIHNEIIVLETVSMVSACIPGNRNTEGT